MEQFLSYVIQLNINTGQISYFRPAKLLLYYITMYKYYKRYGISPTLKLKHVVLLMKYVKKWKCKPN